MLISIIADGFAEELEMILFGLAGFAQSGKDTAFNEVHWKLPAIRVAFADPLKGDVSGCVRALQEYVPGFVMNEEQKAKFRPMWVLWSRISKLFDPMIWVKRCEQTIQQIEKETFLHHPIVIITDVRYDFEVAYIRDRGGEVFYIDREGVGPANDEERISFFDISVNYPDIVNDPIHNDGTKEELGRELLRRMRMVKSI